jgi:hypothetical protein
MALNRKFVLILAILMLGTAFLTGCGEGEEPGPDGGTGITDPSGAAGEEGTDQESDTREEETDPAGEGEEEKEEAATINGTLKAADGAEGTVTIENETDGELVLEVDDKSRILEGESEITFDDLAENIGSEVIAKYNTQTKVVTVIGIPD